MHFENLFGSSGRDPKMDKKSDFIPVEQLPSTYPTPEEQLLKNEEEAQNPHEEFFVGPDGEGPSKDFTEYDRLVMKANNEAEVERPLPGELPLSPLEVLEDDITKSTFAKDDAEKIRNDMGWSFRGGHGHRGREHPGKHMKGMESTRDDNHLS